ncbi:MAG: hypothetical protein P8Q36_19595 [Alphaproteobacteria bacterium]|jgi:hypothetical protein|nr:hypothetical protein [Rhodospirillaceae bacterium]MDG2483045.1 hypothetical protein [Alphaproteobacteria bacterium]MBT6204571.1 hypothetical protein [Rhodospirillaceae bacterium]MBT6510463.1 hypothetical protein [Rhodospirillaceae bacterium]MBT7613035.1 hypothetical protein [Rhodospirillaceae bacterium]
MDARLNSTLTGQPTGRSADGAPAAPEDIFMAWLLCLPHGTDTARAAKHEIARLDTAESLPKGWERLREMFQSVARGDAGHSPARRRGRRH